MANLNVLRPYSKRGRPYHWVHIAHEDTPLCGEPITSQFIDELRPETWDGKTRICRDCSCAHYQYDVNTLQAGQVRRYGPSEYIYDVTDRADKKRDRDEVLAFCRAHLHKSYAKEDMPNWSSPRLKEFTQFRAGHWRYHVYCESTD